MKRKSTTRKSKAQRASVKKKIVSGETIAEKQLAALRGGVAAPKSLAQGVALAWQAFKWCNAIPCLKTSPRLAQLEQIKETITQQFIQHALAEWKPEMLKELAREMKRFPAKWEPTKADWFLLEASKQGPVNLSELKRDVEANRVSFQHLKTWRRTAQRLGVKTRGAGRPNN